jgi:hypothetical protein
MTAMRVPRAGLPAERAFAARRAAEIEGYGVDHQHDEVLRDRKVVDHVAAIDLCDHVGRMRHSSVGPDHRPIEVGRLQTVAEHDHLSGRRVDLRMRAHAER